MAGLIVQSLRRAWQDERGGIAIIFALALGLLLTCTGAAIDYARMTAQVQSLQNAADAAAIAAARELSVSSGEDWRLSAVARSIVNAQLGLPAGDQSVEVAARRNDKAGVDVAVRQLFDPSAIGRLMASESQIAADASAARVGGGKLCVLVLSLKDPKESEALKLEGQSQLTGQDCGVFSNSSSKDGIHSKDDAVLKAALMCSSGGFKLAGDASSRYVGERRTDCPPIDDPLKDRPAPAPGPCVHKDSSGKGVKLVIDSSRDLPAGTYCGGIEIKGKGTVVTLRESGGNNVLLVKDGSLKVKDDAKLYGRGIGIAFDGKNADFEFVGTSTVDLHAPTSGPLAGILFYGSWEAPDWREYKITSDNARVLVGTIYLPKGFFTVDAKNPVADLSAYTAIIVNKLMLKDSPKLVLNTNYHQTQVPVDKGIASFGGSVRLTD